MESLMQVKRADNISGIRDPGYDRPSVKRQFTGRCVRLGLTEAAACIATETAWRRRIGA